MKRPNWEAIGAIAGVLRHYCLPSLATTGYRSNPNSFTYRRTSHGYRTADSRADLN